MVPEKTYFPNKHVTQENTQDPESWAFKAGQTGKKTSHPICAGKQQLPDGCPLGAKITEQIASDSVENYTGKDFTEFKCGGRQRHKPV